MTTDIILSNVPLKRGKSTSIIMRSPDPQSLTWDMIFNFIEDKTKMPRKYIAGRDANGKYIYGRLSQYPLWNFDDYRLRTTDGVYVNSAVVTMHFTCWC